MFLFQFRHAVSPNKLALHFVQTAGCLPGFVYLCSLEMDLQEQ